jgi:hypothetical protein
MNAPEAWVVAGLYSWMQVCVLSIAYCENVSEAIFYWPGVLKAAVVYGTAWVTRTFAFATVNYKEPHELAKVVL